MQSTNDFFREGNEKHSSECFFFSERNKEGTLVRVDKFLKVSRIIKRRTIANEACDAGRVMVNGKVVKAGAEVKIGDIIEIQFGSNTTKIEVLDLKESTKKEDAAGMYRSV